MIYRVSQLNPRVTPVHLCISRNMCFIPPEDVFAKFAPPELHTEDLAAKVSPFAKVVVIELHEMRVLREMCK